MTVIVDACDCVVPRMATGDGGALFGLSLGLNAQGVVGGGGTDARRSREAAKAARKGCSGNFCKYTSPVTNDGGVVDELDLVVDELDFSSRFL